MGLVIAIDGPAGAGKSTVARRIAARLGFTYIDSGAMYRAIALWALRQNLNLADMHRLEQLARAAAIELESARVLLNGEDITAEIRSPEISESSSRVAMVPGVRRALVEKQREIGVIANVVMEGRDIGTVVFPDAQLKIYLDAATPERVRRRAMESGDRPEAVAGQIDLRDERDRTRAEAPLSQAPDAIYLDSTDLSLDEVEEAILKLVRSRMTNGKEFHA